MDALTPTPPLPKPRWDGTRIHFHIDIEGYPVHCAISQAALNALFGRRSFRPSELLRHFVGLRGRIEDIALGIHKIRPENATGVLSIWADDVDDPPAAPAVALGAEEGSG